jgi:hypothetical protein
MAPLARVCGSSDGPLSAPDAQIAVLRVTAREDIVIAEGAAAIRL